MKPLHGYNLLPQTLHAKSLQLFIEYESFRIYELSRYSYIRTNFACLPAGRFFADEIVFLAPSFLQAHF